VHSQKNGHSEIPNLFDKKVEDVFQLTKAERRAATATAELMPQYRCPGLGRVRRKK